MAGPHTQDESSTSATSGGAENPTRRLSARIILPGPEDMHSTEDDSDAEVGKHVVEEEEEGDFLEDFPDETTELELLHSRLSSLGGLRLGRFAATLKKLGLRQNFISFLDPDIFNLLSNLEELDLYDNKVKTVGDALNNLSRLSSLDLSFNLLRAIPDTLLHLTSLVTVYFVQNRISKIQGLGSSSMLRYLELGGNKIRKIENLDGLVNLEKLFLGKNKITRIENMGSLRSLKVLDLQSNRIVKLEALEGLENLEDLYLSHNGIKKVEGLERNLKLKTLDLGNNFIPELENISHLSALEELWISGNKIANLTALEPQLGSLLALETLYLEGNPCQAVDRTGYRRKIMLALPQLKQIDATYTNAS